MNVFNVHMNVLACLLLQQSSFVLEVQREVLLGRVMEDLERRWVVQRGASSAP